MGLTLSEPRPSSSPFSTSSSNSLLSTREGNTVSPSQLTGMSIPGGREMTGSLDMVPKRKAIGDTLIYLCYIYFPIFLSLRDINCENILTKRRFLKCLPGCCY